MPVVFNGVWMTPLVILKCGNLEKPDPPFIRPLHSLHSLMGGSYIATDVTQTVGPAARLIESVRLFIIMNKVLYGTDDAKKKLQLPTRRLHGKVGR